MKNVNSCDINFLALWIVTNKEFVLLHSYIKQVTFVSVP